MALKVIIAGSRTLTDYERVRHLIEAAPFRHLITEVVCGKAPGMDTLGERWAKENNIPVLPYPADWDSYPKLAGRIRNEQMAKVADALICIHRGTSGSVDMMQRAVKRKLLLHCVYLG